MRALGRARARSSLRLAFPARAYAKHGTSVETGPAGAGSRQRRALAIPDGPCRPRPWPTPPRRPPASTPRPTAQPRQFRIRPPRRPARARGPGRWRRPSSRLAFLADDRAAWPTRPAPGPARATTSASTRPMRSAASPSRRPRRIPPRSWSPDRWPRSRRRRRPIGRSCRPKMVERRPGLRRPDGDGDLRRRGAREHPARVVDRSARRRTR